MIQSEHINQMIANAELPKVKVSLSKLTQNQNEIFYKKIRKLKGTEKDHQRNETLKL